MMTCLYFYQTIIMKLVFLLFGVVTFTVVFSQASGFSEKPLHNFMTRNEIQTTFGVDNHQDVPEYDVTHPYQSTHEGEFVSFDLRGKQRTRRDAEDKHHYSLKAFGKTLHLVLRENKHLIAPGLEVETHADGKIKKTRLEPSTHYLGEVRDHPESSVAITNHGALSGAIDVERDSFYLRPLPKRIADKSKVEPGGTPHVVYKANIRNQIDFLNDQTRNADPRAYDEETFSSDSTNATRKYLESAFVAEEGFYKKYGNDTANVMTILGNIVASRFQDDSIGKTKIIFILTRLVYLTDDELNANGKKMNAIQRWASKNNPVSDSDPGHFDVATLLMETGGGGLAGLGNICSRQSSNICGDEGLGTSLTISHETAHNIGVNHDINYGCPNGRSIMSTAHLGGYLSTKWSKCSENVFQEILQKPHIRCLDDAPQLKMIPTLPPALRGKFPGLIYDRLAQCKLTVGPHARLCPLEWHRWTCSSLFCVPSPGACISNALAPVDGTRCGPRNWCIRAQCVDDGSPIIDGNWSEWSEFTPCTRTCGGGVRHRERKCTNPRPQNGGKGCTGSTKGQYEICNPAECESSQPSHRTLQCQKFDKDFKGYLRKNADPCTLGCLKGWLLHFKGTVVDGTRCQNDNKVLDVCIQGKCKAVGCDSKLASGAVADRCGICDGDGSRCERVNGSYTKNYRKYGRRNADEILTLPVGAADVVFQERDKSWSKIGVQNKNGKYLYRIPGLTRTVHYAGSKITHISLDGKVDQERLEIDGPITEPLKIVYVFLTGPNTGFDYNYLRPITNSSTIPSKYEWTIGNWSTCSLTCARGIKRRTLRCVRSDDRTPAGDSACKDKPATAMECNTQNCPAHWHVTEWTPCTRTCGLGSQSRSLVCRAKSNATHHVTLPFSSCDANSKPDVKEVHKYCNEIDCPTEWKALSWSKCSRSCNGGTRSRGLQCVTLNDKGKVEVVAEETCKGAIRPATQEPCNLDVMCQAPPPKAIACFKTTPDLLSKFEFTADLKNVVDWKNTSATIKRCAQFAYEKGSSHFALGNQGICYSGKNASTIYYQNGPAMLRNNCMKGIGKSRFIYAYTFAKLPTLNRLGCYKDPLGALFPTLYAYLRHEIDWHNIDLTINQCARVARDMNHAYFGVHYYGECYTATDDYAAANYAKKGKSYSCWSGVGSEVATFFYTFNNAKMV